jgi:hypothetical protein
MKGLGPGEDRLEGGEVIEGTPPHCGSTERPLKSKQRAISTTERKLPMRPQLATN